MDTPRLLPPMKQESGFMALAETISALIALIQGEKIIYVNSSGCRLLGRKPEYFVDRRFWDVVHPDDREAALGRGLARQAGVPQPTRFTERLLHADGHIVWVDYSVDLIQLDGVTTTLVTGHDITEQKKAEDALRKSERMFRGLYKQSPVMMWSVGWDGRFREVSDALLRKLGYERAEIIGKDSRECLTAESRQRLDEMSARHQAARLWTTRNFPLQVRTKGGGLLDIQFSSVPDIGEDGQPSGWICVAADLSEITRTQEALKLSDARFRLAFENAAIGKAIAGIDFTLHRVNKTYCDMLGYGEPEILTRSTLELTHPDDVAEQRALLQKILGGVVPSGRILKRYLHKDGRIVWGDLTLTLIRDAEGKPAFFVGEVVDVTERKKTVEALRLSEERFRSAFQNAAIGKAITSTEMRFLQVNRAFCDMLGYTEEELVALSPGSITHPDDQEESRALVRKLTEGPGPSGRTTKRYFRKDGSIVWADLTTTLVRDGDGKPAYFVTEVVDITERRHAEERLRDREAKLAQAQKLAQVGSWTYDVATDTSTWSEEMYRIMGIDPAKGALGKDQAVMRFHPDDQARVTEIVARAIGQGVPLDFEARLIRNDGEIRTMLTLGRAEADATGKTVRLFGVSQDITERKRAEELIRDREAKLADAQAIAHVGSWEYLLAENRILWSDEMYRIWGVDRARFNSSLDAVISRIHPKDQARTWDVVRGAMEQGKEFEYEYDVIRDDGGVRSLWSRGRIDLDAAKKPVRIYGITQDITDRKRAEELLRDREAKLVAAQGIAHIGSWEWDIPTNEVVWSDEMYRIVGYPRVMKPTYETYIAQVHPEDRAALVAKVEAGLKDGRPFEHENRLVREDGVRQVWTRCHMDVDAAGRVVRLYGTTQDLTERKSAEQALQASERRFSNLYAQAPVLMTVIGPDLRFREVSNYWLEVFGYDRDEVVGQDGYKFITAESQARHRAAVQQAMSSGSLVIRNVPLQGVRKDGRLVDVLTTSLAEVDGQGRFLGAVTVGVNLSDVRRADEAVRESEARYRALVEHAPEAIVVADADDGKFIDVNEQAVRLFKRSRQELLSLGPAQCSPAFQPDGRPSPEKAQDMIKRTAVETQTFEWVHTSGDGRDIPCLIRLSKMPDLKRNLIRATITDISHQKAMEEKLRQDDRMAAIGVLAAGVAHEIGNPLLALSMATQSLERKAPDEYAARKLTLIREHIERISKIVRQMSDLARAPVQSRSAVDLNRVLERSLEVVRYDKRAKEVVIEVAPCGDIPFVQAAEDQLVQVSLNLALNALDAVAGNGPDRPKSLKIAVRCLERDGRRIVRAGFRDSGPGIPESARGKIFQPFFTTKEPGKGTGLGLSVSYRIIEEHQGKLGFETDPAKGTEFYFELPVREKP